MTPDRRIVRRGRRAPNSFSALLIHTLRPTTLVTHTAVPVLYCCPLVSQLSYRSLARSLAYSTMVSKSCRNANGAGPECQISDGHGRCSVYSAVDSVCVACRRWQLTCRSFTGPGTVEGTGNWPHRIGIPRLDTRCRGPRESWRRARADGRAAKNGWETLAHQIDTHEIDDTTTATVHQKTYDAKRHRPGPKRQSTQGKHRQRPHATGPYEHTYVHHERTVP
jgi:hypothetical protein